MQSDLVERLRRVADDAALIAVPCAGEAAKRIEALEAALDRAVTRGLEQVEQIATLEAALNYVADMTYCGADAEWHFKVGYDPQAVLDALAEGQDK